MYLKSIAKDEEALLLEPQRSGGKISLGRVCVLPPVERSSCAHKVSAAYLDKVVTRAREVGPTQLGIFEPPFRSVLHYLAPSSMRIKIYTGAQEVEIPIQNIHKWFNDFLWGSLIGIYFTQKYHSSVFAEAGVLHVGTFVYEEYFVNQEDLLIEDLLNRTPFGVKREHYNITYFNSALRIQYPRRELWIKDQVLGALMEWVASNLVNG